MTMRHFTLIVLIVTQFSCRPGDKAILDNSLNQIGGNGLDSTFRGHPIKYYIDHDQIPQICKDLFSSVRQPSDENDVLSILDSIFTTNDQTRPFYFFTITRTMDEADGAYAEPLGMMGKQFVETRTLDFVGYFDEEQLLTDTDLEQWAKTVAGEIQISSEGREKEELNSLTNKMKVNCNSCTERQVKILNDFVERVGYHCP
jgi:hypothetical protein